MSLSISPDVHLELKSAAKKGGFSSVSKMLRELIDRHLDLLVNDSEEIPIILRVPGNLRGDKTGLESWFSKKSTAIVDALSK